MSAVDGKEALPDTEAATASGNFRRRPVCELCGGERQRTLRSLAFTDPAVWDFLRDYYQGRIERTVLDGARYEIHQCESCGFAWQAEILTDERMQDLYSVWISAADSLRKKLNAGDKSRRKSQRDIDTIAALLNQPPAQTRVLDFGMGWGYWCKAARSGGYDVRGFELSPPRIEHARQMGIEVIESYAAIGRHRFDFINCEQVFEHIAEPLETLRYLVSTLEDGGAIRISVPDGEQALRDLARPDWHAGKDALHPLEHINCFTHRSLLELGNRAGLEAIRSPRAGAGGGIAARLKSLFAGFSHQRAKGTDLYFCKAGRR